jgi:type IV secretion system protein TrbL
MRSSISDALGTRESPIEEGVETAPGIFSRDFDYVRKKATGAPGVQVARTQANRAGTMVRRVGSKAKSGGVTGVRKAVGSESIDDHRKTISQNLAAADEADANRDVLTEAYQNGELDVVEAANRDILTENERPAEFVSTVPVDAEGKVSYETAAGGETTIDLNESAQSFGQRAQTFRDDASKSARSIKRIRAAQTAAIAPGRAAVSTGRAGKHVGEAGVQAGKVGGIVFAGAMTRSPYAAYMIGKRGGKHLIGPGVASETADSSAEVEIESSIPRDDRLSRAPELSGESEGGGEPSDTV